MIAGVAWAQHVGISRVEVRIDEGPWAEAESRRRGHDRHLAPMEARSPTSSRGPESLQVRATDAEGVTQPEARTEPFPDGATGWHTILVNVV